MKNNLIIIRYGEIALKGEVTRNRFEDTLVNNIINALKTKKITCKIKKERGRIFLITDQIKDSINVLQKIFGIKSISPTLKTNSDIEDMSKFAIKLVKEHNLTKNNSFALRVTRTGGHSYSSQDVAIKIGNDIVKETKAKVNLTNPEHELFIEIRNKDAYFYTEKINCIGGMPLNTQGKVISYIDSVYSILASWYIMRRGCSVIFLYSDDSFKKEINKFLNYWIIKNKKMIFTEKGKNLADILNKTCEQKNCEAIVTGYSIEDISIIKKLKKQCNYPILHPLIAMEKKEIKNECKKIGLKT